MTQSKAALTVFAKFHAFFWKGSNFWSQKSAGDELVDAVWPSGGYWQPDKQPKAQMTQIADHWQTHAASFAEVFSTAPDLQGADVATIGERLESVAVQIGARAHPFGETGDASDFEAYRTVMHGDPKSANIFIRDGVDGASGAPLDIGLIDFQRTGFGLAATDVANHICAALRPMDSLNSDSLLLDHYYAELTNAMAAFGVAGDVGEAQTLFPREVLQEQYETAVLDMCRLVFSYQWTRVKASPEELAANADSFNRNAYNKNLDAAIWLVAKCETIMRERGIAV